MSISIDLNGKVAIVTGAARGIGQAIAELLATADADIAICDLKEEWLTETAQKVTAKNRKVLPLEVDVSKADDVEKAVAKVIETYGHVDILINNAGITRDNLLVRMSEEDWDAVISVNLKGTFLFTKAVARPMIKQRNGVIVNIASIIGLIGNVGQCNYAASKAGIIALTKATARELASKYIRVNAIAPGFIETKMTEGLPEETRKKMIENIPLARLGKPTDIANAVLFLSSDVSSYITGHVLTVSGGMVM